MNPAATEKRLEHAGFTFIVSNPTRILPSTRLDALADALKKPSLPDMVFPHRVSVTAPSGVKITIDAEEALNGIWTNDGTGTPCPVSRVSVAASAEWLAGASERNGGDDALKIHKDYDWTYHTTYSGTVEPSDAIQAGEEEIDWALLSDRSEKILLFQELTLYEDELDDNGTTRCSVRIVCLHRPRLGSTRG